MKCKYCFNEIGSKRFYLVRFLKKNYVILECSRNKGSTIPGEGSAVCGTYSPITDICQVIVMAKNKIQAIKIAIKKEKDALREELKFQKRRIKSYEKESSS